MPALDQSLLLDARKKSFLIWKVHIFSYFIIIKNQISSYLWTYCLCCKFLLQITRCNILQFRQCIQDNNSYRDGNSPTSVDQLLVMVWAWYELATLHMGLMCQNTSWTLSRLPWRRIACHKQMAIGLPLLCFRLDS